MTQSPVGAHQIKSSILASEQVGEKATDGCLITPRPAGDIKTGRQRQIEIRQQTHGAKQSPFQQNSHVQHLPSRQITAASESC